MRLENWSLTTNINSPYDAPELGYYCLQGNVYDHPRFRDGEFVKTSRIIGKIGELIKTKSGSTYELGEVDPAYEKMLPNAKTRLLENLK